MKIVLYLLFLIFVSSCSRTISIPVSKAAVTYNRSTGTITNTVLHSGEYQLDNNTGLALYDIQDKEEQFSFLFLFQDHSLGKLEYSVSFSPIPDSLPKLYQRFNSADYIQMYVRPVTIEAVKQHMQQKYLEDDVNPSLLKDMLEHNLRGNNKLRAILTINRVNITLMESGDTLRMKHPLDLQ